MNRNKEKGIENKHGVQTERSQGETVIQAKGMVYQLQETAFREKERPAPFNPRLPCEAAKDVEHTWPSQSSAASRMISGHVSQKGLGGSATPDYGADIRTFPS
jgi:hypothetical protein